MTTEFGHQMIVWTARLSVASYGVAVWRYLLRPVATNGTKQDMLMTFCFFLSWVWCVLHVVCAFHFQHHWSHAAALAHTAEMTKRVTGLNWGGGLYINYLFLTAWAAELMRIWLGSGRPLPAFQAVAAFMMFNATAVFGPTWWWGVVAGFVLMLGIWSVNTEHTNEESR